MFTKRVQLSKRFIHYITLLIILANVGYVFAYSFPQNQINKSVFEITSSVTIEDGNDVSLDNLQSSMPQDGLNINEIPLTLTYDGPLPLTPITTTPPIASDLEDNWQVLFEEGFENSFPQSPCIVYDDSVDGFDRTWGVDDGKPFTGANGAWPAKGGQDGVDPSFGIYPSDLRSWLICGPYNINQADKIMLEFKYWQDIPDIEGDYFFWGVSVNGTDFVGVRSTGITGDWIERNTYFQNNNNQIWVGMKFHSDSNATLKGEGTWLDDVRMWRYNTPELTCGNLDSGNKGIVLPPYDPTTGGEVPMIRPGDTLAINTLIASDVSWVRLGFNHRNGSIDLQGYDRMIDTLCAAGISVQALVNQETIALIDYDNPDTAPTYRDAFTNTVRFLANYYEDQITYWEVWNEPNLPANIGGPFVRPTLYAPLLTGSYEAIKEANPQAEVLFGGLASAWGDSNNYLVEVYKALGEVRPFDYLALHPYPNETYGPDPTSYMYQELKSDENTLIAKFTKTMFNRNDGGKHIWVTEVGWNSSKDNPNRPVCHESVLVYEEEQAAYLKPIFDTLFNEVTLWNQPTVKAVDKVIWYQYMDVRVEKVCGEQPSDRYYVPFNRMNTHDNEQNTWLFGLYRSDKVTPKPVQCPFMAYPETCKQIFLPLAIRP